MYQGIGYDLAAPLEEVEARGLFVSVATILQATNAPDALGQVDLTATGFTIIAGCSAIPCMRAPASPARITSNEVDSAAMQESFNLFHVLLDGYYPQIPQAAPSRAQLMAVIDGVQHQVMAVENSSELGATLQTRLAVRQVGV